MKPFLRHALFASAMLILPPGSALAAPEPGEDAAQPPQDNGDIIVTGTPVGAGARFDPPKWLKPGDVVEVTVPELGTLSNRVADEA